MPEFTLVSTIYNEMSRLDDTIHDLEQQTILPTQIVVTDAGSQDGTFERLLKWKSESKISIILLQKKGCNVAEGRNYAIQNATCGLIVSTDFGCRFHPQWLESLVAPFINSDIKVVGGNFSVVEKDILTIAAKASYILSGGYQLELNDQFIPSSRSIAYYKSVWEDAKGYPEWLTLAADDLVFGKVIKSKGYKIYFSTAPNVYWGRHTTAVAYGKEAYRYGLGDGEAGVNLRNFISKIVETSLRYLLLFAFVFCIISVYNKGSKWIFLLPIIFLPGLRSYLQAVRLWLPFRSQKYNYKILVYSFYIIELTRVKYIKGYYKGFFHRQQMQKTEAGKLKEVLS